VKRVFHRRLRALETFEAVSRHNSIAGAACELGVTPSAVSHQLRNLAEELGEALVVRHGRGIALSVAGARLAVRLREAFIKIDRSVAEAIGTDHDVLRLAVCSCFAPGWLIGRLQSFAKQNPGIDLQLRMYAQYPELTDHVADAFITIKPRESGFWSTKVVTERLFAVAAPGTARGALPGVRGFANGLPPITTWLEPKEFAGDWLAFCARSGIPLKEIYRGTWLQASHYYLATEMAKAGLGVALVPDFLAESAIASGLLERLSDCDLLTGEDYHLCIKTARRDETALRALASWFRAQTRSETESAAKRRVARTPAIRTTAESDSFVA
jgi:LysR family transcriptional regulator, glycine cleavage system transcriptional activator